jgi:hypothetical protein
MGGVVTGRARDRIHLPPAASPVRTGLPPSPYSYPAACAAVNSNPAGGPQRLSEGAGLGRNIPCMPSIAKNDPWWLADPHRAAYTRHGLLGPTVPNFWVFNPAYASVENTHVWPTAWSLC